jgi:oligopeptide transport system permease protein
MLKLCLRRALAAVPLLLAIVTLSFFLMRLAPGGPFDEEQAVPDEIRRNLDAAYGLDQPLARQYFRYVGGLLRGDFGPSFKLKDFTVSELISAGLPISLQLGAWALLCAALLGLPCGVAAALARGGGLDRVAQLVTAFAIALPAFVVGPLLALVLGVRRDWFPVAGWEPGEWRDMVLPVVTLALPVAAWLARLMRGSLLEVLESGWVRAARARGLTPASILLRHALPPALTPVLSYAGPAAAAVLTGSLVVESIFGIPGMGRFLVQGALNRDYTLVLGMVIVYAAILMALNLLVELAYAALDPRQRAQDPR